MLVLFLKRELPIGCTWADGSSARCHDYPTTTTYRNRRSPTSSSTHRPSSDASARDDSLPVTTRRATQPRRLSPSPSLFLVNYLSKVFLDLFPPPSDGLRQDRTIIRIVISDTTSGPPLSVSSRLRPFYDDCSAVYRTWTDRVSVLPSSGVSPGCSELMLSIGAPACT